MRGAAFTQAIRNIVLLLVKIDDTPQKVSLGFGLGVTLGIIPGTGPIAALVIAALLRLNRAAALTGSLLTNTWLSVVTFLGAVKLGAALCDSRWQEVRERWFLAMRNFQLRDLLNVTFMKIIFPIMLGYAIIALCMGLCTYVMVLFFLKTQRTRIKD